MVSTPHPLADFLQGTILGLCGGYFDFFVDPVKCPYDLWDYPKTDMGHFRYMLKAIKQSDFAH